ncbi:MAG TPA: GNAT family N-acetyltransferase [Anaerolineae bacterium]
MILKPFDANDPAHISSAVTIWNAACGADLAITPRLIDFNLGSTTGAVQAGRIALHAEQPVGFVLASALPNDPQTSPPEMGWIDALAVMPSARHQGIGSALLSWAEGWLREQDCRAARLGGSLRPFVAGYPVELANDSFFRQRGYNERMSSRIVWDVARDLGSYESNRLPRDAEIRPARPGEQDALLRFFRREFPDRWRFEFEEFLRQKGRLSDYLLLLTHRGIDGFAHLTFEHSLYPMDRFYPHRLPRPWAQLGPIGVSADARGKGFGGALLDAALRHLRDRGVRGCVIDWTEFTDFYAKFGFKPYRQYLVLIKSALRND